jgi:predicted AAA+ superfamily ATPase
MKRKIEGEIATWINHDDERRKKGEAKCLLISGQRQVGKTTSIQNVIHNVAGFSPFANVIEINFEKTPEAKEFFQSSLDPATILQNLTLSKTYRGTNVAHSSTRKIILFLDEVQACPEALTSLRFLSREEGLVVIASGSLLGVAINKASSFPTGSVDFLTMHPLDFEEFLWARGYGEGTIAAMISQSKKSLPLTPSFHAEMLQQLRDYLVMGGMPGILEKYRSLKPIPYEKLNHDQQSLLAAFRADVAKYGDSNERVRSLECFDSIPRQLAKDNIKFTYKILSSKGRSSMYATGINWLKNAGIINLCHKLNSIQMPLSSEVMMDQFKMYMSDTGLLLAHLNDLSLYERIEKDEPFIYKGPIYENLAGQMLVAQGYPLCYYEKNSGLELNYVISFGGHILPLEIKSSEGNRSKSLSSALQEFSLSEGLRFSAKETSRAGAILCYPLYLLPFLDRLLA